ncbi:carboxylesterase/lipase family protein [Aerococcaceae bacterium zg-B36]|uniref:carboxylesterase family protein n=1 Tax=Aerococcaceae bacterium zg-252 TaxID=2796928 RepID=UPI001BD8CE91|nr:carboxylesterase/lipase family protein [Aerococcaceae bacterium zg-B36]
MKNYLLKIFAAVMLLLCSASMSVKVLAEEEQNDALIRNIASGQIKGNLDSEHNVLEWLGVPYAKAPEGELRWKAPQPVDSFESVFDATKAAEPFVQLSREGLVGTESSLNLDIVRPNTDEENLPVYVFLHGGNNQTGHAQEIKGNTFANDINAVYVSINYRLGALGFNPLAALKHGTDEENSGNFTLLDIAAALDWVQENIAAFGGNKDNVTLVGFSAGGRDVMATLISPIFAGKFHRAISYSGGMTLADEVESQQIFAKAIASLVVEDGVKATEEEAIEWLLKDEQEVADYLYGLSAERLAGLMGNAGIRMSVFPHLYKDGVVIPKEGFETDKFNDVPLMLITGTNEFSLFSAFDAYFGKHVGDGTIFSDEKLSKEFAYVRKYGGALYRLSNTVDSARMLDGKYQSPIYISEISYGDNAEVTPKLNTLLGSFHGVFEPLLQTPSNYADFIADEFETDGAKELSKIFKEYLKAFVANGNPNADGLPEWQQWTAAESQVLQLDADKDKSLVEMIADKEMPADIIEQMLADTSIDEETKEMLHKSVLNGRWFSQPIDAMYE